MVLPVVLMVLLLFIFNFRCGLIPQYLSELLQPYATPHALISTLRQGGSLGVTELFQLLLRNYGMN